MCSPGRRTVTARRGLIASARCMESAPHGSPIDEEAADQRGLNPGGARHAGGLTHLRAVRACPACDSRHRNGPALPPVPTEMIPAPTLAGTARRRLTDLAPPPLTRRRRPGLETAPES
jgi:hypothetical protein